MSRCQSTNSHMQYFNLGSLGGTCRGRHFNLNLPDVQPWNLGASEAFKMFTAHLGRWFKLNWKLGLVVGSQHWSKVNVEDPCIYSVGAPGVPADDAAGATTPRVPIQKGTETWNWRDAGCIHPCTSNGYFVLSIALLGLRFRAGCHLGIILSIWVSLFLSGSYPTVNKSLVLRCQIPGAPLALEGACLPDCQGFTGAQQGFLEQNLENRLLDPDDLRVEARVVLFMYSRAVY